MMDHWLFNMDGRMWIENDMAQTKDNAAWEYKLKKGYVTRIPGDKLWDFLKNEGILREQQATYRDNRHVSPSGFLASR